MSVSSGGVLTCLMAEHTCQQCGEQFTKRGNRPYLFCTRACADEWTRRDKPTAEWLRSKYIDEGLTANDIARIVNRDPKRVWEWLRQAEIPTRPRGSYNTEMFAGKPSGFRGKKHSPESIERMTAARRLVPREAYAGNGHYLRGLRGDAHPNWKGGHSPERARFYATPEWKLAARTVWGRDLGTCQNCGAQSYRTSNPHERWHIHHIDSFANVELRADVTNLVLLCPKCHRWVHGNSNPERKFLA